MNRQVSHITNFTFLPTSALAYLDIKEEFKVAPKDKLVPIGDTATFDCLPQAWPEPHIQWRRNGRLIDPNSDASRLADGNPKYSINKIALAAAGADDDQVQDSFGSQLTVRQVDKQDEAKYTCLVEISGLHRPIERESAPAQLIASMKPHFIEAPESKRVQAGSQVRLKCRMGGDPEPVISWRKQNGQPLSEK